MFNFVLFLGFKCLKMGCLDVKVGPGPGGQVSSGLNLMVRWTDGISDNNGD